jgi:hypothetical protein
MVAFMLPGSSNEEPVRVAKAARVRQIETDLRAEQRIMIAASGRIQELERELA